LVSSALDLFILPFRGVVKLFFCCGKLKAIKKGQGGNPALLIISNPTG
jgi:hypothetical protein